MEFSNVKFSEEYRSDLISTRMNELNIEASPAMRKTVKLYAKFLSLIHIFSLQLRHGMQEFCCVRQMITLLASARQQRTLPVSYTHLDVYKRQSYGCASETAAREFEWTRKLAEQKGMDPVRIIARHVIQLSLIHI